MHQWYVLGHCHAGRPIDDTSSVFCLRESGSCPRFCSTWLHLLASMWRGAPQYNVSTSVLDSGDGVLWVTLSISLPPNTVGSVHATEFLISNDHSISPQTFSQSFRCLLANLRLACSFGLIQHLSHDYPHPMSQDITWSKIRGLWSWLFLSLRSLARVDLSN